jgi:tetratricopeptide (TPR) repeat protein
LRVRELALRESAVAYAQGGYLDDAEKLLNRLTLPEDQAAVQAEIGLAAQKSGDATLAERSFEGALASISQSQVAMSSIGIALARAGRVDQALSVSQRLAPTTALYALQVSIVASLLEMNDAPRAMEVIGTIANSGIRKAARLRVLGFLVETGEDAAAEKLLTTFADGNQEQAARLAYARALARRGEDEAALAMVSDLRASARSPVHYAIARRLIDKGDLAGAKSVIPQVTNGRQRHDLQRLMALAEWAAGNAEKALATALSIEPEAPRLEAIIDLAGQMRLTR